MPDSRAHDPMPRDWSDAFSTLPLEAPPARGWAALAARLPPPVAAQPRGRRWPRRVAITAALALAAGLSIRWMNPSAPASAPAVATQSTPPADTRTPLIYGEALVAGRPAVVGARSVEAAAPFTATEDDSSVAAATTVRGVVRHARPAAPVEVPPALSIEALDALYAESARLEAVLAHLPDSSAGNVAALAISADLQDQVTHIDLALSQPTLPQATRTTLWEQRVDTLHQLTGVEATQRWQVALNDATADTAIY